MFFKNAFEKQLDEKISRIQNNFENNYKDAAQLNLKEFEAMLNEMKSSGKIKEKRIAYYENKLSDYKNQMQKFTHKDQNAPGKNFYVFFTNFVEKSFNFCELFAIIRMRFYGRKIQM